ncbi:Protein trichome birefringence [Linum perenne]
MLAFVVFTVFLAFNPSPNSSSPWFFSNIFVATPPPPSTAAAITDGEGENPSSAFGSQFPALYSFLFPNNSSSFSTDDHLPQTVDVADAAARSDFDSTPESLNQGVEKVEPSVNNQTQASTDSFSVQQPESQLKNSSILNREAPPAANQTARSLDDVPRLKSNQTSIEASKPAVAANLTASTPVGVEALVESLEGCDFFDGEWVMDDSYPHILNGRPDKDYQKYKWKPHCCTLPRLNDGRLLDMLRGKRLVFIGDSLNRNMWESMAS